MEEDRVRAANHDASQEGEGAEGEEEGPVSPTVRKEEGWEGGESQTERGKAERLDRGEI